MVPVWIENLNRVMPKGEIISVPTPNRPHQGRTVAVDRELMVFTLVRAASKKWRKLNGTNQLPRVIDGVRFTDGVVAENASQSRAA